MAKGNADKNAKKDNSSPWDVLQINQAKRKIPKKSVKSKAHDLFFTQQQSKPTAVNEVHDATADSNEPEIIFTKPNEKHSFEEKLKQTPTTAGKLEPIKQKEWFKLPHLKSRQFKINLKNWQKQTKESTLLILVLVLLTGTMYWFISPATMLQTVIVSGNSDLKPTTVIKAANIKLNRSIFRIIWHEKQIAKTAHTNNDQIDKLSVKVLGPTKIKLTVKESIKAGFILKNNSYHLILGDGKVLPKSYPNPKPGYPIYDNLTASQLKKVVKGVAQLSKPIRSAISEIKIVRDTDDVQKLVLYMNDGNQVYAKISTFGDKMAYYPSIAAQMKQTGIVDLQVGAFSYSYAQQKAQTAAEKTAKNSKKATKKSTKKSTKKVTSAKQSSASN
ncbi:cell division protein FtsQ/DivIB [Periweissella beninensis]|uniref:cell division protein FtsQ/DivIB n=1 Tax=Periweissella beninensis TaxID=504936 RepID=UPI0021A29682|nr:cell division protein FtsQ/DivIB [Periweissella beninensis]MCT4396930.1 FtsQ-type POTRA domain-containing protein [Periweissella beninensis]